MAYKYRHHTVRCPHGFDVDAGICPDAACIRRAKAAGVRRTWESDYSRIPHKKRTYHMLDGKRVNLNKIAEELGQKPWRFRALVDEVGLEEAIDRLKEKEARRQLFFDDPTPEPEKPYDT